MDLLVTIGLEPPLASALQTRIDARSVHYATPPAGYALDGRVLVESSRVAGRMLEPRGVVFYSYFEDASAAVLRRALALGDTPSFPDVRRTLPLDDKVLALVAALGADVPRLARGYLPAGEVPAWSGERVLKWGHRHCGEDKSRAESGFVLPAPAIVEPFVEGSSERILIVGEGTWHLRYESEDWRKNVGAQVTVLETPDPALLAVGRALAAHLGLVVAGIDFIVRDGIPYLLEVNAYPGLDDVPEAQDAFVAAVEAWWSSLASP